ncbi:MAG: biopolymer transport protein ExbB [Bacteroidia bacterium]|jgi:biopolymer transport protein ExbB|tara:strand:- start:14715 stop:15572 length:858 start_codon:yes stop_codon:yes gene_type:complete
MKKFTSLLMLLCLMTFSVQSSFAEGEAEEAPEEMEAAVEPADSNAVDSNAAVVEEAVEEEVIEEAPEAEVEESGLQVLKKKFIEGGPGFMALPLICLILGLAIAIERIISLFWMSINTDKFVAEIESEVVAGNLEGAKEICRNTRGPIASIFYQGLDRASQGGTIDVVEKSVVSYGSVQMGQLEKGLVWLSLFIALAPMLGFMGTVIGMIGAFDAIKAAGDISPGVVADGISVALLTTVAGLIVAIILQVFYNFITSKIDGIVNRMEDSSISLVDMLVKNKAVKG